MLSYFSMLTLELIWFRRDGTTDVTRTFHFGTPSDVEKVLNWVSFNVFLACCGRFFSLARVARASFFKGTARGLHSQHSLRWLPTVS